jgi:NAD(P)-dependent dehydrogenase (short-subunit alcohol dehydrogenase family)
LLVRFSESVAAEGAELGVSVFAVDPGNVPTGMHAFLAESPAWLRRRGSHHPRFTRAERTAEPVVRLASGFADTLTGRLLHAEDDLEQLVRRAAAG